MPLQDVPIGQRDGLSERDVNGLNVLYEAPHVVVAWEDDVRETGSPRVLWAGLSRWGKYAWGPVAAGDGRVPNVEMDQDHTCVVVWHEGDGSTDVRARCATVDGAGRFDDLTASAGPGSHSHPDVAMTPGGELVVVWQTALVAGAQEVRARGYSRSGDERFGEVLVSEGSVGVPPAARRSTWTSSATSWWPGASCWTRTSSSSGPAASTAAAPSASRRHRGLRPR